MSNNSLFCDKCRKIFDTKMTLEKHNCISVEITHKNIAKPLVITPSKRSIISTPPIVVGDGVPCKYCRKIFKKIPSLQSHEEICDKKEVFELTNRLEQTDIKVNNLDRILGTVMTQMKEKEKQIEDLRTELKELRKSNNEKHISNLDSLHASMRTMINNPGYVEGQMVPSNKQLLTAKRHMQQAVIKMRDNPQTVTQKEIDETTETQDEQDEDASTESEEDDPSQGIMKDESKKTTNQILNERMMKEIEKELYQKQQEYEEEGDIDSDLLPYGKEAVEYGPKIASQFFLEGINQEINCILKIISHVHLNPNIPTQNNILYENEKICTFTGDDWKTRNPDFIYELIIRHAKLLINLARLLSVSKRMRLDKKLISNLKMYTTIDGLKSTSIKYDVIELLKQSNDKLR